MTPSLSGGLPASFLTAGTSSFAEFLGSAAPELLPGRQAGSSGAAPAQLRRGSGAAPALSYS